MSYLAALPILRCCFISFIGIFLQTDINSIKSQPNMQYTETSGRVFKRKEDYVNSIVRACARKLQMFFRTNFNFLIHLLP